MRTLRTLVIASALAVPFAGSALAADLVQPQPSPTPPAAAPAPVNTWAGPYAGLYVGYGWDHFGTNAVGNINAHGFNGGAYGGYNWQNGNVVYGLEGDFGYAAPSRTIGGVKAEQGAEGSIRGRVGWAADPFLTYITGGFAATDSKLTAGGVGNSHVLPGWTLGAGVESKLTGNLVGRVEYRFSDYGSHNYATGAGAINSDLKTNEIRVGLGMKF